MSRGTISSTRVLRPTLIWTALVGGFLAVTGGLIGFLVSGTSGLWSALAGVAVAAVLLALTGGSILFANRWYGDQLYVPLFFGIVMGTWLLKFIVFIVVLLVLRDQPWVEPMVLYLALVGGVLGSLVVDAVVLIRVRVPHVSDVALPGEEETEGPEEHSGSAQI